MRGIDRRLRGGSFMERSVDRLCHIGLRAVYLYTKSSTATLHTQSSNRSISSSSRVELDIVVDV
jgi:hypothetical protein